MATTFSNCAICGQSTTGLICEACNHPAPLHAISNCAICGQEIVVPTGQSTVGWRCTSCNEPAPLDVLGLILYIAIGIVLLLTFLGLWKEYTTPDAQQELPSIYPSIHLPNSSGGAVSNLVPGSDYVVPRTVFLEYGQRHVSRFDSPDFKRLVGPGAFVLEYDRWELFESKKTVVINEFHEIPQLNEKMDLFLDDMCRKLSGTRNVTRDHLMVNWLVHSADGDYIEQTVYVHCWPDVNYVKIREPALRGFSNTNVGGTGHYGGCFEGVGDHDH